MSQSLETPKAGYKNIEHVFDTFVQTDTFTTREISYGNGTVHLCTIEPSDNIKRAFPNVATLNYATYIQTIPETGNIVTFVEPDIGILNAKASVEGFALNAVMNTAIMSNLLKQYNPEGIPSKVICVTDLTRASAIHMGMFIVKHSNVTSHLIPHLHGLGVGDQLIILNAAKFTSNIANEAAKRLGGDYKTYIAPDHAEAAQFLNKELKISNMQFPSNLNALAMQTKTQ